MQLRILQGNRSHCYTVLPTATGREGACGKEDTDFGISAACCRKVLRYLTVSLMIVCRIFGRIGIFTDEGVGI